MASMFVRRSGTHASWAFSSKPGPKWSNVGGLRSTAAPPRGETRSVPLHIRHIRRLAAALAGLAGALLAFAATAPAAFARPVPPPDIHQPVHQGPALVPVHTVVVGGMPGWQITLVTVGAALLAAALAVLLDRAWAARRHANASTA